ncbi:mechanosensitive ion channel domain-containing protein [Tardiphaga sp. 866_E4_N2_1]|uniref:mechanosensitive ion channel domain-containing protein n=1 Tax=unclassified Tardiphaga TaxID=2631404 RepID=UPI003F2006C0
MNPVLIPAAALVTVTAIGILSLRRFSDGIRLSFDLVTFASISLYFFYNGISPFFPPPSSSFSNAEMWMRAIGGSWWLLGARIIVALLRVGSHLDGRAGHTTLFSDLFGAVIYICTTLVILNSVFSLPVTGLLATSGVLAIVLGLALQNTLADVFAGMAVSVEKPFDVGDRIQIDNKIEGHVAQMNWRSIRLQTDGDDIAIIPNSQIAKAEIVNRSFPGHRRAASIFLGWPALVNPERVIETLRQAILLCPDILREPEPTAFLSRLGATRNNYTVSFFVENTSRLGPTKDALLRNIRRQLYYAELLDDAQHPRIGDMADMYAFGQKLLADLILLECLSTEHLRYLSERLEVRRLEPGEMLFVQGNMDASLYVVATGVLEFSVSEHPNPVRIIGRIGAGEYVGELGLLTGEAHSSTATALTYCTIYHFPITAIAPLLEKNPELAGAFDKSLRHGLDSLRRRTAPTTSSTAIADEGFLPRIKHFFQAHLLQAARTDAPRPNQSKNDYSTT